MRVLILDIELSGLDFANRCVEDGHDVRLWQATSHPIGRGFIGVKRVQDWRESMSWAKEGLIVTTGNAKLTQELDRFRDLPGFNIFGPTWKSARLEIDRKAGMEAMEAAGIDLPHYECFSSLKDAEAFARKADGPYVFKPLGSEDDKSLTYVASDPADLVGFIQRQIKRGSKVTQCMLQEKIDMLAEIGVSGWMGPEGFLEGKWQECFEHKKLMEGEIGPNTGEMGTVCQYVTRSKLADDFLKPLEPILRQLGHRGDFAIGCGVDSAGKAWPFEFTARLGWPAFYIQVASHQGDVAEWMLDLCRGQDTLRVDTRPAIGVVLAQPPWPKFDGKADCVEGVPVTGLDGVWPQVHPVMMQISAGPYWDDERVMTGPQYQTAGELVAVMTGLGSTVERARSSVYKAIDEVGFSDAMFRRDIGEKLERCLPKLHSFGYAKGMAYG